MPKLLGFQLASMTGANVQGDDGDPTGLASFEVMAPELAAAVIAELPPEYLLFPIFEGDIEEPVIVEKREALQRLTTRNKPMSDATRALAHEIGEHEMEIVNEAVEQPLPKTYTARVRRSRTYWQDAMLRISAEELAAALEKIGESLLTANPRAIEMALEEIGGERERDLDWTTDDAETNDLRVVEINGENVDG